MEAAAVTRALSRRVVLRLARARRRVACRWLALWDACRQPEHGFCGGVRRDALRLVRGRRGEWEVPATFKVFG